MLSFRCRIKDCDHVIKEAQHVDDVVTKLREHYRAQHPKKAFYQNSALEDVEAYNMDLDDFFNRNYGPGWVDLRQDQLARAVLQITRPENEIYYGEELRKEAADFIEAANAAQPDGQANQQAAQAANADDLIFDIAPNLQVPPAHRAVPRARPRFR